jgi:hypothetical protein
MPGVQLWWRYAFLCTCKQMASRHMRWNCMLNASKLRKEYVPRYVQCLVQNKIGGDEVIEEWDRQLPEPSILLFR